MAANHPHDAVLVVEWPKFQNYNLIMLNEERELLKITTAHVINESKIDRHNAVRVMFEGIVNEDKQLTTTKNTLVNTITKEGPEYF